MNDVAKETAKNIMQMIVDSVGVGANTDDFDTAEWIVEAIATDYGLSELVQPLWDEWWKKNGDAQNAWYGRKNA